MKILRICGSSSLLALVVFAGCDQRVLVGDADGVGGAPGSQVSNGSVGGIFGTGGGAGSGVGGAGGALPPNTLCSPISVTIGQVNLCGHTQGVAYSPDGTMLAIGTSSTPRSVQLFSLPDGAHLRDFAGGAQGTYSVAFSPDGKTLAVGGSAPDQGTSNPTSPVAMLYDVATGALLRSLPTTSGFYVDSVAFSLDGLLLATGGYMGAIEVWRVSDGTIVTRIPYMTSVHNVHFAPTSTQLIVGGVDERATIWNIPAGTLAMTLAGIANEMADAAFSPDGQRIATTSNTNNDLKIWDAASGALLQTLSAHTAYVSHVVWIDQDRFLSDDWSGVVHAWTRSPSNTFTMSGTWSTGGQGLGMAVSRDKTRFVVGAAAVTASGARAEGFVFLGL